MPGSVSATIVSSMVWWALILGTAAATTTTTNNQSSSTTKQRQHSQLRHHGPVVAEDTTTRRRTQHAFSSPFAPGGILNPTTIAGDANNDADNENDQHDFVRDGHVDDTPEEMMGRQDLSPVLPCDTPGAKATLYNLLCSESEFTMFCNSFRDNFGVDLNNLTAHYTLWAPTDEAWEHFFDMHFDEEFALTSLLDYHVSEGLHYQKDLLCGANTSSVFHEQPHELHCRDHHHHRTLNGHHHIPTTSTENGRKLRHVDQFFFHFEECLLYNNNTIATGLGPTPDIELVPALTGDELLTVFAPTDAAFLALPAALLPCLSLPENKDTLIAILTYHITNGHVALSELTDGEVLPTLLEGQDVTVTIRGDGTVLINEAHVVIPDVEAKNIIVHAIDAILVPPSFDITAFLATCPAVDPDADHSTLNGPDYEVGTLNTNPDYLPKYDASTYNPDVADNAFIRGCNGIIYTLNNVMLPNFSLTPVPTTSPVPHVSCSPSTPTRTSSPTLPPIDNISFPPSSQQPSQEPSAAPSAAPSSGPTVIPHISCNPTTAQPTVAPHISCNPTTKPTLGPTTGVPPTPAPIAPVVPPTDAPTVAPTDSFTLSPTASTSSVVTGVAAPGSPVSEPERRLSENILTVADFVQTLNAEIDSLLGVPDDSSCIVESSAIQYAASDSECTALFTAAQLVGVSFCYRFQTTISPPTSGEDCEVNAAAQLVAAALIGGDFADAIGPAADIVELSVPTNSPTSAPTEGPTAVSSARPTAVSSTGPSVSNAPSGIPSVTPSTAPSVSASSTPSTSPSDAPSNAPSGIPSVTSSTAPSISLAPASAVLSPTDAPTGMTFGPTSMTFGPTSMTFGPTSETEGPTSDLDARTASVNTCGNDGSPKSILDYVCWMDNFSLLCKALHRVGMTRLFSGVDINGNLDSTTTFTLFVPVNEAMEEAGLTFDNIEEIDDETLQNIIKSHIMIGSMKNEDLICGEQYESMLSSTIGEDNPVYSQTLLKVDCMTILESKTKSISGFYNTDLKNQPTMLSPNDIRLCNGYVQPIGHIIQS